MAIIGISRNYPATTFTKVNVYIISYYKSKATIIIIINTLTGYEKCIPDYITL